jgi:hypothetical protein
MQDAGRSRSAFCFAAVQADGVFATRGETRIPARFALPDHSMHGGGRASERLCCKALQP